MTSITKTCWAIVPAGGSSQRFSPTDDNKLLADLNELPVIARTVQQLALVQEFSGIVMVCHPEYQTAYKNALSGLDLHLPVLWTTGGDSRRGSVYNGLLQLPDNTEYVAVHDAARPLIQPEKITDLLHSVQRNNWAGGLLACPVVDTLKSCDDKGLVINTVDRSSLWQAQTPQVFKTGLLKQAHQHVSLSEAITDDAQLIEQAGLGHVGIVAGDKTNLKITTTDDLMLARYYHQNLNYHQNLTFS